MTEQRMVPMELLKRILSITQPIAPSISAELRAIIDGPGADDAFTDEELSSIQRVLFDNCGPATAKKVRAMLAAPSAPEQAVPDGVPKALQSLKEQVAAIVCHKLGHPGTAMAVQEAVIRLINRALAAIPQPTANAQPSVVACPLVNDPEGRN